MLIRHHYIEFRHMHVRLLTGTHRPTSSLYLSLFLHPRFFYKSPPPALVRQTRNAGWDSSRRHKPSQVRAMPLHASPVTFVGSSVQRVSCSSRDPEGCAELLGARAKNASTYKVYGTCAANSLAGHLASTSRQASLSACCYSAQRGLLGHWQVPKKIYVVGGGHRIERQTQNSCTSDLRRSTFRQRRPTS